MKCVKDLRNNERVRAFESEKIGVIATRNMEIRDYLCFLIVMMNKKFLLNKWC